MAYPNQFLRLAVSGTLYATESFSWSLSLIPDFPTDNDGPETIPAGVVSAVQTFHVAVCSAAARLTTIKLNEIGTDGRYAKETTVFHDFAPPGIAGGGSTNYHAPQVALAVTLRTAAQRGLANSGRFYIPTPRFGLGTDGRLAAADAALVAGHATTMLNSIDTALAGWDPGVVSDVRGGEARRVTHVDVGRVLDTIRSRRTSLLEDRQLGTPLAEA